MRQSGILVHPRQYLRYTRFHGAGLDAEVPRRQCLLETRLNRRRLDDFVDIRLIDNVLKVQVRLP